MDPRIHGVITGDEGGSLARTLYGKFSDTAK